MAFVVETGAGLSNANSYASVAAADDYVSERGIAGWADLGTSAKQQALIKATDYLEATYRDAWKGDRVTQTQALSWPRLSVYVDRFLLDGNIVPQPVVKACIEMAMRSASGEVLIADQGQRVKREKVDVIEVEYQDYSDPTQRYPFVNRMLTAYLKSSADGGFAQVAVNRT